MKILYHHRIASRDGGSTHIEEMIKAFQGLGHTVSIAAPSPGAEGGAGSGGGLVAWLESHLPRALYEVMEFGYSAVAYRRLATLAFSGLHGREEAKARAGLQRCLIAAVGQT